MQATVYDVLIKQKGTNKLAELFANDKLYLDEDSSADELLSFVGNHDMGRFAYHVGADENHQYSDDEKLVRTQLAHAMIYFSRGIPVIYYGDEQGFTGDGGDRKAREDMMPSKTAMYNDNNLLGTEKTTADNNFDTSHPLYKSFQHYSALYQEHPTLRHGKQRTVHFEDKPGLFVLSRQIEQEKPYFVIYNTANEARTWQLPAGEFEAITESSDKKLNGGSAVIAPLSFAIYRQK